MEYRLLGSSGCAVSALALGTLTFGNETDQATSFSQLDVVRKVAGGRRVPLAQVAIAWLMARPAVSSVILGARSMHQLTDNLAAAGLTLSPEETRLLDEASEPPAPDYPYGVPGQSQRGRRIQGGRF